MSAASCSVSDTSRVTGLGKSKQPKRRDSVNTLETLSNLGNTFSNKKVPLADRRSEYSQRPLFNRKESIAATPELKTEMGGTMQAKGSKGRIGEFGDTIGGNTVQGGVNHEHNVEEGESLAELEFNNEASEGQGVFPDPGYVNNRVDSMFSQNL